ncbi:hypothetical protein JQX13_07000 [Archangium violaceum]|uniref:hypothetical protein n=1 Tax=Archangium violaceum TaxID=83451 RepID=UPI00193BAB1C|nr:hypothetical protein [Archangium violaceum]QRK09850.1 hypothetical protein JQX13_07000 [Archangium violaceum]
MRGNIRRWLVVGALASASLLFPGCTNTNRGGDEAQNEMGTGGSGSVGLEEQSGMGGSGSVSLEDQGLGGSEDARQGAQGTQGDVMTQDAGTGGAGLEGSQSTGTKGRGVTGAGTDVQGGNTPTPSSGVPSGVPGK